MVSIRCGKHVISCPICLKKFRLIRWCAHIYFVHTEIFNNQQYVFNCPFTNICQSKVTSINSLIKHGNKCHNLPRIGKLHRKISIYDFNNEKLKLEESDNEELINSDYETDNENVNFLSLSRIMNNSIEVTNSNGTTQKSAFIENNMHTEEKRTFSVLRAHFSSEKHFLSKE
uniref:C2H2-type domain-containing protein n=1 Tax=Strongyloides stercoralis TaxID=6248 RepID=A0A0K0DTT0_STRER